MNASFVGYSDKSADNGWRKKSQKMITVCRFNDPLKSYRDKYVGRLTVSKIRNSSTPYLIVLKAGSLKKSIHPGREENGQYETLGFGYKL